MSIETACYLDQLEQWPSRGRHILAQFDDTSVVVYQAYKPAIGRFAAERGYFGGEWKADRMTWIKPNFLWMMYRSAWGTRPDQEITLAVHLKREAFDRLLDLAEHTRFDPAFYASREQWESALKTSPVRLQWDPDHSPAGLRQERRAIQLGLKGEVAQSFSKDWLLAVEDISEFVLEQRARVTEKGLEGLLTPIETVYPVASPTTQRRLGLDSWHAGPLEP